MNRFLFFVLTLLATVSMCAHAATFVVTRLDDPAPNGCQPGDCSLREAAIAADSNDPFAARDVIQLGVGTCTLTLGVLPLNQNLEVVGAGSAQTKIVTAGSLFTTDVHVSLYMHGMTLMTGQYQKFISVLDNLKFDDIVIPAAGGEVYGGGDSDFVSAVDVSNSELGDVLACKQNFGTCTIVDSRLADLEVKGLSPGPAVVVQRSSIDGDLYPGAVTGIIMSAASTITIEDSDISNTLYGLLFFENPDGIPEQFSLRRVSFVGNKRPIEVQVPATIDIADSEFRDNVTEINEPGAIWAEAGSDWHVAGSTFAGNVSAGSTGGAIRVETDANLLIENSTFSGNSFTAEAAAAHARGAAIGYRADPATTSLTLQHVTIVAPTILPTGIVGTALGGDGGGTGLSLTVLNSIVRGTCGLDAGAMDANLGNIESGGDTCAFGAGNLVGVSSTDLAIGTLGDHGGLTRTYEPGSNSVALGAANPAFCLPADQRGYQRAYPDFDGACDVGAVERGAEERVFADGFEG